MTTHADHPTDTVNELLARARTCLAEGDLMQASANGWRAARADGRGRRREPGLGPQHSQRPVPAVDRLAEELSDRRLGRLFRSANSLDQNSYEDDMPAATVAVGIDDVEQFAAALESHLP